jgi:hypothetical protein
MISIDVLNRKLIRRVTLLDRYITGVSNRDRHERFAHQSFVINHLWQTWVDYNRSTLTSCLSGKLLVNGNLLKSPISNYHADEQLYLAQQYADGITPKKPRKIKSHLAEPNWGDIDKICNLCSNAQFDHAHYISNCYGLAIRLKDLQLCRNTCAHLSINQIKDFNRSRVRYKDNGYMHPSDMLNWIDPETGVKVWDSWCGEMQSISELIAFT